MLEPYSPARQEERALIIQGETAFKPTLDQMVTMWVHAKYNRSRSEATKYRYELTMQHFRELLAQAGLDLDGDPATIAMLAQGWAAHSERKDEVASGTHNAKICCISSFYEFALKRQYLEKNPMKIVELRPVEYLGWARPLSAEHVVSRLQAIDRTNTMGKRDYALFVLAFTTGRRLSELRNLEWGDFVIEGDRVTVIWRRVKGGKRMEDELQPGTWAAIRAYLQAIYGNDLDRLPPDTPIWIVLGRRSAGCHLSIRGVSDIYRRHFGTGKVHTSRHTFAVQMEQAGAKMSDIGSRLGHENLTTTSVYLQRMHSAENAFAPALEQSFGIAQQQPAINDKDADLDDIIRMNHEHQQNGTNIACMSDEAIGRMVGVSGATVRRRREALGLPSWYKVREELIDQALRDHPTMTDTEHARILGVSAHSVMIHRQKLGSASLPTGTTYDLIDQALQEHPELPDLEHARQLGVSDYAV